MTSVVVVVVVVVVEEGRGRRRSPSLSIYTNQIKLKPPTTTYIYPLKHLTPFFTAVKGNYT